MSTKIYVGNMNYSTTDDQLAEHFAQYGDVRSANIIIDRYTNQSKGFGFIEMEEADAATAAISALNGADFQGRQLRVNEAHEKKDRPNRY